MTAVWALDLQPSHKLVLLALADNANDEGLCWPSIKTITLKTSLSERTVQSCLASLIKLKAMRREMRDGKSSHFTITPANLAPRKSRTPRRLHHTPASAAPPPPQISHPEPSIEPSKEPSDSAEATTAKEKRHGTGKHRLPDDWKPNDRHIEKCGGYGFDVGELVNAFRRHHLSKGSRFERWDLAFDTWIANESKFGASKAARSSAQRKPAYGDHLEDASAMACDYLKNYDQIRQKAD